GFLPATCLLTSLGSPLVVAKQPPIAGIVECQADPARQRRGGDLWGQQGTKYIPRDQSAAPEPDRWQLPGAHMASDGIDAEPEEVSHLVGRIRQALELPFVYPLGMGHRYRLLR